MFKFNSFIKFKCGILVILTCMFTPLQSYADMYLKGKLEQAQTGDYLVTALDNTYIVLVIKEHDNRGMAIEEITIPAARLKNVRTRGWHGWKHWVEENAPGHTSWVVYTVDTTSGDMHSFFSYTKNCWGHVPEATNFLTKLLNLRMTKIADYERKKIGPRPPRGVHDSRRLWVPKMVHEGSVIPGTDFDAWRTRWPRDSSDLSHKAIIVYLPKDEEAYPAYFPYWLEVHGVLGKAKVRIIDSGRNLQSPQPSLETHMAMQP